MWTKVCEACTVFWERDIVYKYTFLVTKLPWMMQLLFKVPLETHCSHGNLHKPYVVEDTTHTLETFVSFDHGESCGI